MSENKPPAKSAKFANLLAKSEQPSNAIDQKKEILDSLLQQAVNTEVQQTVLKNVFTAPEKIKATFELDAELHSRVKIFAAGHKRMKMVDVVTQALIEYLDKKEGRE